MCKSFDSSFTFREWVWCPPSETEENRKKKEKLGKIRWAAATTGYSRPRLIASVSKHRFACCSCSRARPTTLSWFITRIVPQLLFMIHISLTTTTQQKTNTHTQTQKREGLCPLTSQSGEDGEIGAPSGEAVATRFPPAHLVSHFIVYYRSPDSRNNLKQQRTRNKKF